MYIHYLDSGTPGLTGNSFVLIGSISAVIIVCIVAAVTLAAVVLYRKGQHVIVSEYAHYM